MKSGKSTMMVVRNVASLVMLDVNFSTECVGLDSSASGQMNP